MGPPRSVVCRLLDCGDMPLRSPLSLSLLASLLLVGCEPAPVERPTFPEAPEETEGPTPVPEAQPPVSAAGPLKVPIPEGLRAAGSVLVVTRMHEQRTAQESVTAVAAGAQEFEIPRTPDEVLSVSVLNPTGALSESALVNAGAAWPARGPAPQVLQVPKDYPTIQAAVDAAHVGDTVLVKPGTYFQTVRLKSGIRLLGSGAAVTFLDGGGHPLQLVDFSGATDVVVSGFTFQNVGSGSVCDDQAVTECGGGWYSAALFADGHDDLHVAPTSALVTHNVFRNNSIAVMLYFHARAVVRNNVFVRNTHGFVANHFQDVALLANNVFWENTREAIVSQAASLDILNNVVARSQVGILHQYVQTGRIRCNLFFQNDANGADLHRVPPRFEIGQDGNIELDPHFELPSAEDFRPAAGSPVVDAGCYESLALDRAGERQDIGAYGGPLGHWP